MLLLASPAKLSSTYDVTYAPSHSPLRLHGLTPHLRPQLSSCNNYMATISTTFNVHQSHKEDEPREDTDESHLGNLTNDVEVLPEKKVKIGKDLMHPHKEKIIHLLKGHLDIFA